VILKVREVTTSQSNKTFHQLHWILPGKN